MQNQTRTFLMLALFAVGYLLVNQWMTDYHQPVPQQASTTSSTTQSHSSASIPGDDGAASIPARTDQKQDTESILSSGHEKAVTDTEGKLVSVTTDVFKLEISTQGGTIASANLRQYPVKYGSHKTVQLLSSSTDNFYQAQSGLIGIGQASAPNHKAIFSTKAASYELAPGQDTLDVAFDWTNEQGVTVRKIYTFHRGSYNIGVKEAITNKGNNVWKGRTYRQLQRVEPTEKEYSNFLERYSDTSRYSFFGAAWYGPDDKFNKLKFDKFKKGKSHNVQSDGHDVTGGWIAMEQAYFVGAWLPSADKANTFTTLELPNGDKPRYLIRSVGPVINVAPGQSETTQAHLFLGPKVPSILKTVAPSFDLALNYGMMTIIARPLHWVLAKLHGITGNWGWAIILLVLLINAVCYKLYAIQYRSSARMRNLKPRMDALKERYGSDRQKLQKATMEMYKKEKINPMSGCLPILVTLPIFFGLYELLRESVELRQAPFIGWIHDLSAADPYFVLPIFYGIVMLIQSLTMPMSPGMDGTQQKMIRFMPVATALFFAFFPAGLALYYSVNGICRLTTMWWVYRKVDKEEAHKKAASSKVVSTVDK